MAAVQRAPGSVSEMVLGGAFCRSTASRYSATGRLAIAGSDQSIASSPDATRLRLAPDAAPDLKWLPHTLHVETNHFAISRKAEDFNTKIADFNRGLAAIEADGTLETIIAEHGF